MGRLFLYSLPGMVLAFAISGISYQISKAYSKAWFGPALDMFIMCVLFGLVAGLIISIFSSKNIAFAASSAVCKDILVPVGLVLYGTQIDFKKYAGLNYKILLGIVAVIAVYFLVIWLLNRYFGVNEKITMLTCVGSSICGASAIAVTSPFVEADDEDTSSAMITILVMGLISVFALFALQQNVFHLSGQQYANQIAMVHNQTGLVKMGAEFTGDKAIRDTALATKYIRTSLIIPLAFLVVLLINFLRKRKGASSVRLRSTSSLLILGLFFFGASLLFSFVPSLGVYAKQVEPWFKIIFGAALASIGFACNARAFMKTKLLHNIASAFVAWAVVVVVSYLFVSTI